MLFAGLVVLAGVLLVGLLGYWWWRARALHVEEIVEPAPASPTPDPTPGPLSPTQSWRGVLIVPPEQGACAVSCEQAGTLYVVGKAPATPLAGCTSERCLCRYEQVENRRIYDRRVDQERRGDVRYEPDKKDRRLGKDRRYSDRVWQGTRH